MWAAACTAVAAATAVQAAAHIAMDPVAFIV